MDELADRDQLVPMARDEELALAEAREALLDAREALLDERDTRADSRDDVADARDASDDLLRAELQRREELLRDLIHAADARDRAAELRDRAAHARDAAAAVRARQSRESQQLDDRDRAEAGIDRLWAAQNRDEAAADRADLREIAREDPREP